MFGDSHYGCINDPAQNAARNYDVYPAGWLLGYAGQHIDDTRVTTTLNITGKIAQYPVVSRSNFQFRLLTMIGDCIRSLSGRRSGGNVDQQQRDAVATQPCR